MYMYMFLNVPLKGNWENIFVGKNCMEGCEILEREREGEREQERWSKGEGGKKMKIEREGRERYIR